MPTIRGCIERRESHTLLSGVFAINCVSSACGKIVVALEERRLTPRFWFNGSTFFYPRSLKTKILRDNNHVDPVSSTPYHEMTFRETTPGLIEASLVVWLS